MEINGRSLKELWIAVKWAKLVSILTVGMYFILILISIFSGLMTALFAQMIPFGGFIITSIYLIFYSLTLLIPGILLYNFAVNTQKAIAKNEDELVYVGFKRLRQLFQYSGILTIITIILSGISIVFMVIASIF